MWGCWQGAWQGVEASGAGGEQEGVSVDKGLKRWWTWWWAVAIGGGQAVEKDQIFLY